MMLIKGVKTLWIIALLLILTGCCSLAIAGGPWKGKVLDVETKVPPEGVVILAAWEKVYRSPAGASSSYYHSKEVVTDKDGKFEIPNYIAINFLPIISYMRGPLFTIYKPGYGCVNWQKNPLVDFLRDIFKMPMIWWPWMAGLPLINLSSIFFLPRKEAWVVLGTGLLAATIMTVLHAKLGYVRLLGVGHFVWIPMLIWLVFRFKHIPRGTLFHGWILILIATDTVSLLIDIVEFIRYLRGDRAPLF